LGSFSGGGGVGDLISSDIRRRHVLRRGGVRKNDNFYQLEGMVSTKERGEFNVRSRQFSFATDLAIVLGSIPDLLQQ
jgi:hypothetical protein